MKKFVNLSNYECVSGFAQNDACCFSVGLRNEGANLLKNNEKWRWLSELT